MGMIEKIVKAGIKTFKGKKPAITFDANEGLYRVPVKGGKPYFTSSIDRADSKASELYGKSGFTGYKAKVGEAKSSMGARTPFGGKHKKMATKEKVNYVGKHTNISVRRREATQKARLDSKAEIAKTEATKSHRLVGKGKDARQEETLQDMSYKAELRERDARVEANSYGKIGSPLKNKRTRRVAGRDYASKKSKEDTRSDRQANKDGESLVKAGMAKFNKTLSADDLFKGEKVPRKRTTSHTEVAAGIKERANATKRKQRYKAQAISRLEKELSDLHKQSRVRSTSAEISAVGKKLDKLKGKK